MLQTVNLTKNYGKLTAVNQLNLEVKAGELFGFLGPNGAGKTTTIKMMAGILTPTQGQVFLDGINVHRNPVQAKSLLAYVPDQPNLYEKLSPREFLSFIADIYRMDRTTAERQSSHWLELFNLSDRADELMGGFSHGMKQKVSLIAALLHEPRVLFLDEPTVGLDPRSARMIKDLLRTLCQKGVTVFMSTHILEIAERMCDRIGIIQNGQLLALGSMEELRTQTHHGQSIDGSTLTLEDLFLELTGGAEYEEISQGLEE
jgi:ABC-2 type transport system ATP-binding protein